MTFVQKKGAKNVDEIDGWSQFHQHILEAFLREQDEKLFWQMSFGKRQINLANFILHIGQQNVG